MAVSSRRAGASNLRDAIQIYRFEQQETLEKWARELLTRLADSPNAANAFDRLRLKDRRAEARVVRACVEAQNVARTFSRRLKQQKDVLVRAKRWDRAVAELRKFVAEVADQKEPQRVGLVGLDHWSLSIFEPPAQNAELKHALDLIASAIEWRRGIAEANMADLGATRDAYIKQAPENAAIWVLAAGVYDAARKPPMPGKPHVREVADLAEAILGTGAEVFLDRVRNVLRMRRQLYAGMIGNQTQRYMRKQIAEARRRRP
jgi:hypothetical protein